MDAFDKLILLGLLACLMGMNIIQMSVNTRIENKIDALSAEIVIQEVTRGPLHPGQ
jgi:hypothetical protein